jgi:chromosome segregation ATPase
MPASPLVKIHEDRIARLEEDMTECRIDLGVVKTQVTDIREQLAEGISMLSQKLDGLTALDERVTALETTEKVKTEIAAERHARRSRRAKVIGLMFAGVSALSAILGKVLFGG